MAWKRAARPLLIAACLVASGCAGFGRPPAEREQAQAEEAKSADERHADLERELTLYSD